MGQILHKLAERLYSHSPESTLYHYTSLKGLKGIIDNGVVWASEIKYLNDADELTYLAKNISWEIARRRSVSTTPISTIMDQFDIWTRERLTNGHMLFVSSFTEHGNLLSQWRGYCPFGQGVSIGFSPIKLKAICGNINFSLGRCVYDSESQIKIVNDILDGVVEEASRQGPSTEEHPDQNYYKVFEDLEPVILRISALFKNGIFKEEGEWRLVSPIHENYKTDQIEYRVGTSTLIPYLKVPIRIGEDDEDLAHIYVGPTPTPELSARSVQRYVSRKVRKLEVRSIASPYRG